MNGVHSNPEELKKFARYLTLRSNELKEKINKLEISFNALSDFWKDPIHEKFKNQFVESLKCLKQFIQISNETSLYLN